ncbi:hypothetical protein EXIGLDRAFT_775389 [Exidia glandulosa HHB12029]|uniref:Cupredoxin n=1 Tax=Exidia glandulosa HHB12029 TaxID=1314781 RepID=A0A165DXM6_EXIGL|nr:hypothetical protein EXIGLDRAFT_775389 [Exidia glandulosa HHB12029]
MTLPRADTWPVVDVQIGTQESYNLHANTGDIVTFHFPANASADHSIVQSQFESPCTFLDEGFSSGRHPDPSSVFRIQLLNDHPVYFGCIAHCHEGEVGIINAAPDAPLEAFVTQAKSSTPDFSHVPDDATAYGGGVYGAVVAPPPDAPSEKNTPSWLIAVIVLGVVAAIVTFTYVMYRVWLRMRMKDLAEWRAMRSVQRDDDRTMVNSARSYAARESAM